MNLILSTFFLPLDLPRFQRFTRSNHFICSRTTVFPYYFSSMRTKGVEHQSKQQRAVSIRSPQHAVGKPIEIPRPTQAERVMAQTKAMQAVETNVFPAKRIGRPSAYTPSIGPDLIECMSQGMGFYEGLAHLGFTVNQATKWLRQYPEFKEAYRAGRALQRAWWERVGRINIFNPNFNATMYIYLTANFFGWRRADPSTKVEVENTGKITHDHRHVVLKVELGKLTDEQLRTIEAARRIVDATAASDSTRAGPA